MITKYLSRIIVKYLFKMLSNLLYTAYSKFATAYFLTIKEKYCKVFCATVITAHY